MLPSSLRCFFLPIFLHHLPAFGTGIVHRSSTWWNIFFFFSFVNLSFLLRIWSFMLSCLCGSNRTKFWIFWFLIVRHWVLFVFSLLLHSKALKTICMLITPTFIHLAWISLQCFIICPNLLSWQIHMDVAQTSLT